MNNQLKSLSVMLLTLGLSMPAFAASSVYVPSQRGGFEVGVDVLYLKPTNSHLDYATELFSTPPRALPQIDALNFAVEPSFDLGVYGQVGYLFPYTGNDITIGYTYLRNSEVSSVDAPLSNLLGILVMPLNGQNFIILPNTSPYLDSAKAKAEFSLNQVDLELGQRFTTSAYDLRMFGGLRYARLNNQLLTDENFSFNDGGGNINAAVGTQKFSNKFNGIGPRIGANARYAWGQQGFGLDANLSTALLIGNMSSQYGAVLTTVVTGGGVVQQATGTYLAKDNHATRVIPVVEAKLGVDYTRIVDARQKSSIVIELGYQVVNYFNAAYQSRVVNNVPSIAFQNATSDVGFNGVYAGVKYYA